MAPQRRWRAVLSLGFALGLTACMGLGGPLHDATPIPVDPGRAASLVSAYRTANGLAPVGVDPLLTQAAREQALAMGRRDKIGHGVAGRLPGRVAAVGYDWGAVAENLGAGYANLDAAMQGWKISAEHRRNLLNPHVTEIGVAAVATPPGSRYRTYWALILATERPQASNAGPFGMAALR